MEVALLVRSICTGTSNPKGNASFRIARIIAAVPKRCLKGVLNKVRFEFGERYYTIGTKGSCSGKQICKRRYSLNCQVDRRAC
eukprot:scaffold223098_cov20-Tisochrysis_lutea.AAC.1